MALDTLDYSILTAILAALIAYFTKGKLWAVEPSYQTGVSSSQSRDLRETLDTNDKKLIVFYGSQTGTAEDYAAKLSKELSSRFNLPTLMADLADYDFDNLNDLPEDCIVFFLMATYGEGEPTDNAVDFMDYLENEASDLNNLKFACFGLGNSTYEIYNAMGKLVDTKLAALGASRIGDYGEGDDGRGSMDEDYLAWKETLFEAMKSSISIEEHELTYNPAIKLVEVDGDDEEKVFVGEPSAKYLDPTVDLSLGPFDHRHPYLSPITKSKELFNSTERSCVHAEFDLSNTNLRYSTGDHLALWPSNSNDKVEKFLKVFGLEDKKNSVFTVEKLDPTVHIAFPIPTTYETVVRHYLEISGAISRQTLSTIKSFAPTEESKKEVERLAGDKEAFASEIHSKYLDLSDVLLKLSNGQSWASVPFAYLIETIAHLQPRYYSISSSSLSEKTTIHVTAVVEAEKLKGSDHIVTGVATNLLKNIELSQNKKSEKALISYDLNGPRNKFRNYKLPIHVRRSTFKLPTNPALPVIMIGPGTGVAPFRGFIRERVQQKANGMSNIGKSILFYGCRNSEEDFLYKDEWPTYSSKLGENFELITAFSRESEKKVYVQHKLLERSQEINELLSKGAFLYVCGDASRMARDVHDALVEILTKERKITKEMAVDMVRNLKVQNRYQEDVW